MDSVRFIVITLFPKAYLILKFVIYHVDIENLPDSEVVVIVVAVVGQTDGSISSKTLAYD